ATAPDTTSTKAITENPSQFGLRGRFGLPIFDCRNEIEIAARLFHASFASPHPNPSYSRLTPHHSRLTNHFIGPLEHAAWNRQTDLFCRLKVYDEFKLRCLLHRQI